VAGGTRGLISAYICDVQKRIRRHSYPRGRRDLTLRPLDGQFSLYDGSGTRAEPLSLIAALIWTYCDGQHHVDAIAAAVVGNLPDGGDPDTARREVAMAVDRFAAQGLLS
jgi:hypothetical protein